MRVFIIAMVLLGSTSVMAFSANQNTQSQQPFQFSPQQSIQPMQLPSTTITDFQGKLNFIETQKNSIVMGKFRIQGNNMHRTREHMIDIEYMAGYERTKYFSNNSPEYPYLFSFEGYAARIYTYTWFNAFNENKYRMLNLADKALIDLNIALAILHGSQQQSMR